MATIDIILIVTYFIISIAIALFLSKRGGSSTEDFFLSGRKLPWWVAGTTMVATTFAADTPLAVTELVAKNGIAGNWLWWNMVAGSVLTVFFFAKLWRRANILTDVEFIEIRYSGKPAAFLRGFKAIYLGVFMNVIIMGWVNLALATVLKIIFNVSDDQIFYYIVGAMLLVGIYSAISGLWGIAFTDMFQFVVAMAGCIVLTFVILDIPEIGGIEGLKKALPPQAFNFFPEVSNIKSITTGVLTLSSAAFIAHMAIQWWASWYPGAEPGGGGYVAQRMMSTKDEKHSVLATLWFTIAYFTVRPWPWIIVGLATLVLYPDIPNAREGYVMAMKDHLPAGLLGLLIAAFFAAYMSTISTQLNWGSSYLINDLYKRFIKKDGDEKHYVLISRIATIILVIISSLLIKVMDSISGAWAFILECSAGIGVVLILRWFWWRINAWSEIVAMIAPFIGFAIMKQFFNIEFPETLFFIVAIATISWLVATFMTPPDDEEKLESFYKRVQPDGPGWKRFAAGSTGDSFPRESLTGQFINWILGIILVYSSLFGIGKLILGFYTPGIILVTISVVVFIIIGWRLKNLSLD